jgi:hypothetical protein
MQRPKRQWPFQNKFTGASLGATWPYDPGLREIPRRWSVPRERWDNDLEDFPGAVTLEDLQSVDEEDDASAARIVARFLVHRYVVRAVAAADLRAAGGGPEPGIRQAPAPASPHHIPVPTPTLEEAELLLDDDRQAAADWVMSIQGERDAERYMLLLVVRLASAGASTPNLCMALNSAAAHAGGKGHHAGAFGLYRASYRIAIVHGWAGAGARAARAISQLAEAGGGRVSVRRWRRRAAALFRRELATREGRTRSLE